MGWQRVVLLRGCPGCTMWMCHRLHNTYLVAGRGSYISLIMFSGIRRSYTVIYTYGISSIARSVGAGGSLLWMDVWLFITGGAVQPLKLSQDLK